MVKNSSSSFTDDVAANEQENQFILLDDVFDDVYGIDALTYWELIDKSDLDEVASLSDDETVPTRFQVHVFEDYVLEPSFQAQMTAVAQDLPKIEEKAFEGHVSDEEERSLLEDEEEEQEESELDDELVPWAVSDRLGRERMRKFGARRDFAKMNKAKRLVCMYNTTKPGCLHGKRGLGMKHR